VSFLIEISPWILVIRYQRPGCFLEREALCTQDGYLGIQFPEIDIPVVLRRYATWGIETIKLGCQRRIVIGQERQCFLRRIVGIEPIQPVRLHRP